jgi:lipoprotein-releasing system permease protein
VQPALHQPKRFGTNNTMAGYEWMIGTRYLRSTHRRGFVSFVAFISVSGLMLGVATLIVVLSVINGFERELRTRMLSVTSHATLMGLNGPLENWPKVVEEARRQEGVIAAVPYIEAEAMIQNGKRVTGSRVRGVLPEEESAATGLSNRMLQGSFSDLQAGEYRILLGSALARELNARVGDSVVVIAPEGTATPAGVVPRQRRFHVAGIFESGMYEYDRGLAVVHMTDAARLYRYGDDVTGVRLALEDPLQAPIAVRVLALALGGNFTVTDWTRSHSTFFRSIEITKSMLFIILLMLVAVAAFNIVATLVMIVKEKQTDIAILRTLGAGPRNILGTFAVQGVMIGLVGTAAGAALGILVARNIEGIVKWLERVFNVQFLDASVYSMSDLPAYVEWMDVVQVCSVAFLMCALATLYPSWRAARTAPAEALRHD